MKTDNGEYELFDSLGTTEAYVTQTVPFQGDCEFNTTPLQEESSSTCGEFCVFYICHRLFNLDLDYVTFLNDFFSDTCSENETRIATFLNDI